MPESAEPLPASGAASRVAAGHATAAVPSAAPHELAGDVRGGLVGDRFESAEDVIVLEGGSVVGILPVERLLAAPADLPVRELMIRDPVTITPDADEVFAAHRLIGRHEIRSKTTRTWTNAVRRSRREPGTGTNAVR